MNDDVIPGVEYCDANDEGFTERQRAALRNEIRKHPAQYVWLAIDIVHEKETWFVGSAASQYAAQTAISPLYPDHRIFIVQTNRIYKNTLEMERDEFLNMKPHRRAPKGGRV